MAITKLGSILLGEELVKEAARWHDYVGKLSEAGLERIRKAGLIKPVEEYIAGINRGTKNIARRAGYKINDLYGTGTDKIHWREAKTNPLTKTIEANIDNPLALKTKSDQDMFRAILNRHEAYEASAAAKAARLEAKNPEKFFERAASNLRTIPWAKDLSDAEIKEFFKARPDWAYTMHTKRPGLLLRCAKQHAVDPRNYADYASGHFNIDVLTKERKLLDRNPYRHNKGQRFAKHMRRQTGETQFLDTLGGYGDPAINKNPLERFNQKNIKRMNKNWGTPVTGIKGANGIVDKDVYVPKTTELHPIH